jgi:hypothetical protein
VNSLFEKISGDNLLEEYPEIEQRRKILDKSKKELMEIKKQIENIL